VDGGVKTSGWASSEEIDPVKAKGTRARKSVAFQQAYGALRNRILAFTAPPIETLDRITLQKAVNRIAGLESRADA
jgi:hypothetical protein